MAASPLAVPGAAMSADVLTTSFGTASDNSEVKPLSPPDDGAQTPKLQITQLRQRQEIWGARGVKDSIRSARGLAHNIKANC